MGIDTPLQIEALIAFGAFTAAIITAFVWYLLKSKSFPNLNPNRLNLTFLLLFFFTIAAVMSFLLFNALAYGDAVSIGSRDTGKVYTVSQDPVSYWVLVAIYYSVAVAALSTGLVMAAKLIQPRRSLSAADFTNKAVERVGESAGPSSDNALDAESGMSDSPYKPFERLWQYATVIYFAGVLIALYVYTSGDWDWKMPVHLPVAALALVFVSFGLLAIYTGKVWMRGGAFLRSKNPIMYWVCVATILFFGIFLFLAGIGVIGQ